VASRRPGDWVFRPGSVPDGYACHSDRRRADARQANTSFPSCNRRRRDSAWSRTSDHTKFVIVEAPNAAGQTFRVTTGWR
jgi:hypothetical protein